jgi:AbiV family abortive infection protein
VSKDKRKYRNGVTFVVQAVRECCKNALGLATESQAILDHGRHALALSIAVLSLEELGKATMIDGLLLAKAGDYKTKMFEKGHTDHPMKLIRILGLHMWITVLAQLDPRWETDDAFREALAVSVDRDREIINDVLRQLDSSKGFAALDSWKQRGFYVNAESGGSPQAPADAVSKVLAVAVVLLARRLATLVDFVFSDNYKRYEQFGQKLRRAMTEADHEALHAAAIALVSELAPS